MNTPSCVPKMFPHVSPYVFLCGPHQEECGPPVVFHVCINKALYWEVAHKCVNTGDMLNHQHKNWYILPNVFHLCLSNMEIVNRIFIHYKYVMEIWYYFLTCLVYPQRFHRRSRTLFEAGIHPLLATEGDFFGGVCSLLLYGPFGKSGTVEFFMIGGGASSI